MNSVCLPKTLVLICLLLARTTLFAAEAIQDEWDDVSRVVVVGDVHGDYDNYFEVLREADLVNRRGNWIAGDTHFVQLGDVPDRGPDTDRIIKHLQKLEAQARRRGGMVHILIGNHEFMNVIGDLRYVHPGEYDAFTSPDSSRFRDSYYQQTVQALEARNETSEEPLIIDDAFKQQWYEQFPLGFVEHRLAWQPGGDINEWISTHNSIIRIKDTLFMHAGLGPDMLDKSITEINEQIRREILGDINFETSLGESESGPLWYRGLALNPESLEVAHLDALLESYQVSKIIVGHTPNLGVITPRFGGQVIITDTGISTYYGGHKASLLMEDGLFFALQEGEYIPLPVDEEGVIPYFKTMSARNPLNQRLASHLEWLINPPLETDKESEAATLESLAD